MEFDKLDNNFDKILNAIKKLANLKIQIIITYPNSDFGGKRLFQN